MAGKTRFEDDLGDHDGDNPANWSNGLPQTGYDVRIGNVEACYFAQGYQCLQLVIEYDTTTVTFDGGNWTCADAFRLEHGTVLVTDEMVVDGSFYVSDLADWDLTRLSVRFTQARNLVLSAAGFQIGDVVWTSNGASYYATIDGLDCTVLDLDGQLRFTSGAPVVVRENLILRSGALVKAIGNDPVFTIEGNVTASGAECTWLTGTGGCHFTGTGDQIVDLGDVVGPPDPVIINKPSGRLVLQSSLPCDGLDHQAGELVLGGNAIATSGSCRIAPGARVAASLDGSVWTIGGSLDWQGQKGDRLALHATAPWFLRVHGDTTVRYVDAAFCDARGGTTINARDGTSLNGGNNLNWLFPPEQPFRVAAGCVHARSVAAGMVAVPAATAGETFVATAQKGVVHA